VSEKSNEITAIPKLLEVLLLKGCIVTIDAMGCQTEIASKIKAQDADYILAAKENQKHLYGNIKDEFRFGKDIETTVSHELDHGRIETIVCSIITDFKFIGDTNKWGDLKTVVKIESKRAFNNSNKPTETAERYYISSLQAKPEDFQKTIRSHWPIENKLLLILDVAFSEGASRKRQVNAAQNFSMLKKKGHSIY